MLNWNVAGLSEYATDPVTLKVDRGVNVRGFDSPFLSQLSIDAHIVGHLVAAGVFEPMDGVYVGAHELFTPSEGDCDA